MKWTYKCHNIAMKPVRSLERFLNFIGDLSWTYAHYRNGGFPYQYPDQPRLRWVKASHWQLVKEAWRTRDSEI